MRTAMFSAEGEDYGRESGTVPCSETLCHPAKGKIRMPIVGEGMGLPCSSGTMETLFFA